MNLPKRTTVFLIEEIPTDGHSPLKFICDDGANYFCKYRVNTKKVELDCLIYEVVCSVLLRHLKVPTPEIALIEVTKGSYDRKHLKNNRYITAGVICFGSKELKNSLLVTELDKIANISDFEKYKNPEDVIKIALFDLWVGNQDRGKSGSDFSPGRSNNYNLLTELTGDQRKIYAFDHGFTFDGEHAFRIFNERFLPNIKGKLFGTQIFDDMLQYIPRGRKQEIVESFITAIKKTPIDDLISPIISNLPADWRRHEPLKDKIVHFLKSESRIEVLTTIAQKQIIDKVQ